MKNKIIEILSKIFNKNKKYVKDFFKKVFEIIKRPEMKVLPAHLAFSVLLSFIPIVSVITLIGASLGVSVDTISSVLGSIFTNVQFNLIIPSFAGLEISGKFIIVIIIMLFLAANGASSIIIASDQIYGIKPNSFIQRRSKAILMTFMLCILYIFVLIVPLLGNKIIEGFDYFDLKIIVKPVVEIIKGPISWLLIYFFIKSIYVMAPDKEIDSSGLNKGALFTTIFWVLATLLYSLWINNFNEYDMYYGNLSSIAILMLWIYWLSYIFVIGLSLNVKVDNQELEKSGKIKKQN